MRERLLTEGLRSPEIFVSKVEPTDPELVVKESGELISRVDVVCISGEPAVLCTALAINATKERKMTC